MTSKEQRELAVKEQKEKERNDFGKQFADFMNGYQKRLVTDRGIELDEATERLRNFEIGALVYDDLAKSPKAAMIMPLIFNGIKMISGKG